MEVIVTVVLIHTNISSKITFSKVEDFPALRMWTIKLNAP